MRGDEAARGRRHAAAAELLAEYALAALDPEEHALVERHLDDDCEDCGRTLAAFQRVAGALALATPLVTPAARLKQRVLAQAIRVEGAERQRSSLFTGGISATWLSAFRRPGGVAAMAASVGVAAVVGLATWNAVLHDRVGELEGESSVLAVPVQELAWEEGGTPAAGGTPEPGFATQEALFSLSAPDTEIMSLRRTEMAPAAKARMIWEPQKRVYTLVADGLPPTVQGTVYIVWVETVDGGRRIGHFYVDQSGRGFVRRYLEEHWDEATGLVVTLEPGMHVGQRTADPVLLLDY